MRSPSTSERTLAYYEANAQGFWEGTRDHDVAQNRAALLEAIEGPAPFTLLDLGCGPGRDLLHFASLGHHVLGLDGCRAFCDMARALLRDSGHGPESGCEVLHQDFLKLDLHAGQFDGVFANASLFHVPSAQLPRVLRELRGALKPGGVLFSSNPRGNDEEGWRGDRYGCQWELEAWRERVTAAGFDEIGHYYRPPGLPREQQPWLATVWRRRKGT